MKDIVANKNLYQTAEISDFFALLKPRVMSLVVFTAMIGLFSAPQSVNPILAFASILFIAVGAGASGALNMWWDADIDKIMHRTRNRPIPSGRIRANDGLIFGLWLVILAVMMLGLSANWIAASLLAFTIFFYVVIYSMWLKRLTPQNIVIGGIAGAFPPMIGWAVATATISIESVLMFAVIFLWTPPHFWALALYINADYEKVGVPMLTVTHGKTYTRTYILIYTLLLLFAAVALAFTTIGGIVYFLIALILSLIFLGQAMRLVYYGKYHKQSVIIRAERGLFKFSIIYLFILFMALGFEVILNKFGLQFSAWPHWI